MTDSTPAVVEHGSALALTPDQAEWNEQQLVALRHIGLEYAGQGDLTVFHHVCQRTGLDPFARQIHMISRKAREQVDGEWQWVNKQTIQTGIDGFRLIGRRAADQRHERISVEAPQWAHADGTWRDVWVTDWGYPIAARITIRRGDEPFTAVAMFDEYKQTKSDGSLTRMWDQRRAGQLAKCAEALAWRMAFPQDLSGIYSDDEMGQADTHHVVEQQTQPAAGRRGIGAALREEDDQEVVQGEVVEDPPETNPPESPLLNVRGGLARRMFGLLNDIGKTDKPDRLAFVSEVTGRVITSSSEMTDAEAQDVIDRIEATLDAPFPDADTTTTTTDGADA